MRTVILRKGIRRTAYHADGRCFPLIRDPHKCDHTWEAMTEERAQLERGLDPCKLCVSDPVEYRPHRASDPEPETRGE